MQAVQNLPAHQQQEFMQHLEQMQLKDSLTYVAYFSRGCCSFHSFFETYSHHVLHHKLIYRM